MKTLKLISVAMCSLAFTTVNAAEKDTRAGNCEDAKSQYEYFCKGNSNDIMMTVPIACNNAKKNMAAACEGKVEADQPYKFDDKK
jgi:benzoyl-CoA reductase/2-hydroxyglutaryl-CoA dehydratase subunit BcrC/BadD/HgdB